MVWPQTRGGPSAVTCLRTLDHNPSAPINSEPVTRSPAGEMRRHRDAVLIVVNDLTGDAQVNQRAVAAGF